VPATIGGGRASVKAGWGRPCRPRPAGTTLRACVPQPAGARVASPSPPGPPAEGRVSTSRSGGPGPFVQPSIAVVVSAEAATAGMGSARARLPQQLRHPPRTQRRGWKAATPGCRTARKRLVGSPIAASSPSTGLRPRRTQPGGWQGRGSSGPAEAGHRQTLSGPSARCASQARSLAARPRGPAGGEGLRAAEAGLQPLDPGLEHAQAAAGPGGGGGEAGARVASPSPPGQGWGQGWGQVWTCRLVASVSDGGLHTGSCAPMRACQGGHNSGAIFYRRALVARSGEGMGP